MKLNYQQMAWRLAQDLPQGTIVTLGPGLPQLVADYLPRESRASRPGEYHLPDNGIEHQDSLLTHTQRSLRIRVLEAAQVSETGHLAPASITVPGSDSDAMEPVTETEQVLVITELFAKDGSCKLVPEITLPLSSPACVAAIYTDIAVFDICAGHLVIREIIEGITLLTLQCEMEAEFQVSPELRLLQAPILQLRTIQ